MAEEIIKEEIVPVEGLIAPDLEPKPKPNPYIKKVHENLVDAFGSNHVPSLDLFTEKIKDPKYRYAVHENLKDAFGVSSVPDFKGFNDSLDVVIPEKKNLVVTGGTELPPTESKLPSTPSSIQNGDVIDENKNPFTLLKENRYNSDFNKNIKINDHLVKLGIPKSVIDAYGQLNNEYFQPRPLGETETSPGLGEGVYANDEEVLSNYKANPNKFTKDINLKVWADKLLQNHANLNNYWISNQNPADAENNKIKYNNEINNISKIINNIYSGAQNSIGVTGDANSLVNLQNDTEKASDYIKQYVRDPNEQKKALTALGNSTVDLFGSLDELNQYEEQPLGQSLGKYQSLALNYLRKLNKSKAEFFDKYKDTDSSKFTLLNEVRGFENQAKQLDELGVDIHINWAQNALKELDDRYKQQGSLDTEDIIKYQKIQESLNDALNWRSRIPDAYPNAIDINSRQIAQDYLGTGSGVWATAGKKAFYGMGQLGESLIDLASYPFRSQEEIDNAALLASGVNSEIEADTMNRPDARINKTGKVTFAPELLAKMDEIKNSNLPDDEKAVKVANLLETNQDKYTYTPADGDYNLGFKSIAASTLNFAADMTPFMLSAYGLGGVGGPSLAGRFANMFGNVLVTSYSQEVGRATRENIPNPQAYALGNILVNSLAYEAAGVGTNSVKYIRGAAAKTGNLAEKVISKLDDQTIIKMLENPPSKLKGFMTEFGKTALKTGAEGVKNAAIFEAFMTAKEASEGKDIDLSQHGLNMLNFALFHTVAGTLGEMATLNSENKKTLYQAALNKDRVLYDAKKAFAENKIKELAYNQIVKNVEAASKVLEKVPMVDENGKKLNDKDAADLLYLKIQSQLIQDKLSKDIPEKLKQKIEKEKIENQKKIDKIVKGFTENIGKPFAGLGQTEISEVPKTPSVEVPIEETKIPIVTPNAPEKESVKIDNIGTQPTTKPVVAADRTLMDVKKDDIEKRRQEELDKLPNKGIEYQSENITLKSKEAEAIDAKYDAELKALESKTGVSFNTGGKPVTIQTKENLETTLQDIATSGKKPSAETLFNLLESIPDGTIIQHEGGDTRTIIKKKRVSKSGNETYELIPEIYNEETNQWEENPSALTILEKTKNGEYRGTVPEDFKQQAYTDKNGNRVTTLPKVTLPSEGAAPVELKQTEVTPEVTVEGTKQGYQVLSGNKENAIGDIRQEASEARAAGKDSFTKETVKDGKKTYTLVDTTVSDDFGRPGFKSASISFPEKTEVTMEDVMPRLKTELGIKEEVKPTAEAKVASDLVSVSVAPYYDTQINNISDASKLRDSEGYKGHIQMLKKVAKTMGLEINSIDDTIGGFENEQGNKITEISNRVKLNTKDIDAAEKYAAVVGALAHETQEATIAARYVKHGDPNQSAIETEIKVSDLNNAVKSLKEAGINSFEINENDNSIKILDFDNGKSEDFNNKMLNFADLLDKNNVKYETEHHAIESRYVDPQRRAELLKEAKLQAEQQEGGTELRDIYEKSKAKSEEFLGKKEAPAEIPEEVHNPIVDKIRKGIQKLSDKAKISVLKGKNFTKALNEAIKTGGANLQSWGGFEKKGFEESPEWQKLIDNGTVKLNFDLKGLEGKAVVIINPDNMLTGEVITKDGKKVVDGNGGINFVTKFGDVWASSDKDTASQLAGYINEARKKDLAAGGDGTVHIIVSKGRLSKSLTSHTGAKAAMKVLEHFVDKKLISLSDFRKALIEVGKKYNIDFDGRLDAKSIHDDIAKKFFGVNDSTFSKRGFFVEDIINHLAENSKSAKENISKIREMLNTEALPKSTERKTGDIFFAKEGIIDAIGHLLSDNITVGVKPSEAYATIEVKHPVEVFNLNKEEGGHESYPFHLRQIDENGNKVKPILNVLNEAQHITDVVNDVNNRPVDKKGGAGKFGSNQVGMAKGVVKPASEHPSGVNMMTDATGKIYGFEQNGKIVLNADLMNGNTPFHEAGHLWLSWAKENRSDLHEAGMSKVEGSKYLQDVKNNPVYQENAAKLPESEREDYFKSEALAKAIGDNGEQFVNSAKKADFKQWLKDLWTSIADHFGLRDMTAEQVSNMTLDDFSKKVVADIVEKEKMSGKGVETEGVLEPAKMEKKYEEIYKDLTNIEKRQIINSKFEKLLEELKIEKICPTD